MWRPGLRSDLGDHPSGLARGGTVLATPLSCGRKVSSLSSVSLCLNFAELFHPGHSVPALMSKDERYFHRGPGLACPAAERSGHSPRTRGGKAESIPSHTSFLVS